MHESQIYLPHKNFELQLNKLPAGNRLIMIPSGTEAGIINFVYNTGRAGPRIKNRRKNEQA